MMTPVHGPKVWWTATAALTPIQAGAITSAWSALKFMGFSSTQGDDGRAGIEIWSDHPRLPAAVLAAWQYAALPPLRWKKRVEATVMADLLPSGRTKLAPGLWLDHSGDLSDTATRTVVRLPPSHAWGDGRHPTTRMLAGFLMATPPLGARVLDLGCGTGVLGVTAMRLGAASLTGTDVDPLALVAARAAARVNGVKARIHRADLLTGVRGTYDVVIANLFTDLLLSLASDRRFARILPTGCLLISGVSRGRWAEVATAWQSAGFRLDRVQRRGFWAAGVLTR